MKVTREDEQAKIKPHDKNNGVDGVKPLHNATTRHTAPGPPLDLSLSPTGCSFLFI